MPSRPEDEWGKPYRQTDLPKEEHDRLVAELRANPGLLRKLLRQTSQEDESLSASLLFGKTESDDQEALDKKLRRYLLRDQTLTDEEIARLEESFVEDERYFDRMLLVENELIEDYLRGAFTAEEEQRFNNYFLITPERREKLRRLRVLAMATPVVPLEKIGQPAIAIATSSWWQSLLTFVRPPNLPAGALTAVVILLLIVGAFLWLTRQANQNEPLRVELPTEPMTQNTSLPPSDDQNNLNGSHETINTSSPSSPSTSAPVSPAPSRPPQNEQSPMPRGNARPTPSQPTPPTSRTTVFALVPGVLRGGGGGFEKRIAPGSKIVELKLRLDLERDYDDFLVVVQDSNGREVAQRGRLKAMTSSQVKASTRGDLPIVFTVLPAVLFKPDDYTVILSGKTNGEYKEVDRYSFRVLK